MKEPPPETLEAVSLRASVRLRFGTRLTLLDRMPKGVARQREFENLVGRIGFVEKVSSDKARDVLNEILAGLDDPMPPHAA